LRGGFRHVELDRRRHRQGRSLLIPLEDSYTTIPTVLFFRDDDNKILYGRAAIAEYVGGGEGRHMRALKSILGTELMHERTRLARISVAFADVGRPQVGNLEPALASQG
jgi:hypothetical chaperone protein